MSKDTSHTKKFSLTQQNKSQSLMRGRKGVDGWEKRWGGTWKGRERRYYLRGENLLLIKGKMSTLKFDVSPKDGKLVLIKNLHTSDCPLQL